MNKSDLYLKGILTIIAVSLAFIAVELGTSAATAQSSHGPTDVVITGVSLVDRYGNAAGTRLPVDTGVPVQGGTVPVMLQYSGTLPVEVQNETALPVKVQNWPKATEKK